MENCQVYLADLTHLREEFINDFPKYLEGIGAGTATGIDCLGHLMQGLYKLTQETSNLSLCPEQVCLHQHELKNIYHEFHLLVENVFHNLHNLRRLPYDKSFQNDSEVENMLVSCIMADHSLLCINARLMGIRCLKLMRLLDTQLSWLCNLMDAADETDSEYAGVRPVPKPRGRRKTNIVMPGHDRALLIDHAARIYRLCCVPGMKWGSLENLSFKVIDLVMALYGLWVKQGHVHSMLEDVNRQYYALLTDDCHLTLPFGERLMDKRVSKLKCTGRDLWQLDAGTVQKYTKSGGPSEDEWKLWSALLQLLEKEECSHN